MLMNKILFSLILLLPLLSFGDDSNEKAVEQARAAGMISIAGGSVYKVISLATAEIDGPRRGIRISFRSTKMTPSDAQIDEIVAHSKYGTLAVQQPYLKVTPSTILPVDLREYNKILAIKNISTLKREVLLKAALKKELDQGRHLFAVNIYNKGPYKFVRGIGNFGVAVAGLGAFGAMNAEKIVELGSKSKERLDNSGRENIADKDFGRTVAGQKSKKEISSQKQ
jgi:hypothetical protein